MSLRFSAFIFPLLLVSVNSAFPSSPEPLIKLAYGISQAAYYDGNLIDSFGRIMRDEQNIACYVGGWQATRSSFTRTDETVVVFWHYIKRLAVFGFRGTDDIKDWMHNLDIRRREISFGRNHMQVHAGFLRRYDHIQRWFENEYQKLLDKKYRIIITGHSLGGAMAKIASAFAAGKLGSPPDAVITFAAPKVGNSAFKNYYERAIGCYKTIKIEVQCDPIAQLPTWPYVGVCSAVSIKRGLVPKKLSCHSLTGHYLTGLQTRYGVNLQNAAQACDK